MEEGEEVWRESRGAAERHIRVGSLAATGHRGQLRGTAFAGPGRLLPRARRAALHSVVSQTPNTHARRPQSATLARARLRANRNPAPRRLPGPCRPPVARTHDEGELRRRANARERGDVGTTSNQDRRARALLGANWAAARAQSGARGPCDRPRGARRRPRPPPPRRVLARLGALALAAALATHPAARPSSPSSLSR